MLNDVISDMRTHILRHFPERQIYLRSGGEVKYFVLSTKLQLAVVSVLSSIAQIMGTQTSLASISTTPTIEYVANRVLMAPTARDASSREARRDVIKTASMSNRR